MNTMPPRTPFARWAMALVALVALALPQAAAADVPLPEAIRNSPGYVDFGDLEGFDDGSEMVNIRLTKPLLKLIGAAMQGEDPATAEMLQKLLLVNVRVFTIADASREDVLVRMEGVASKLGGGAWQNIVQARDGDERVNVYVQLSEEDSENPIFEGLAVTMLGSDDEAVFVNIVGQFTMEDIARVGTHFDIDVLDQLDQYGSDASDSTGETY